MAIASPGTSGNNSKKKPISIAGMSGEVQGVDAKNNLVLIQLKGMGELPSHVKIHVSTSMSMSFSGTFDGKTVGSDPAKYRYIYKYNPKSIPDKVNVSVVDNRASATQSFSVRIKTYIESVETASKPSTGGGSSGGGSSSGGSSGGGSSSTTPKKQDSRTMQESNKGSNNNSLAKKPSAPIFKNTSSQSDGNNTLKRMAFRFDGKIIQLKLNPEEYTQAEPGRGSITQTKGGAWLDDFGAGLGTITMRGTTGFKSAAGDKLVGFSRLKEIRDMVRNYYAKGNPGDLVDKFITFHNFTDGEHWDVYIKSFTLMRSVNRPLVYLYDIQMVILKKGTSVKYENKESRYQYVMRTLPKKYN